MVWLKSMKVVAFVVGGGLLLLVSTLLFSQLLGLHHPYRDPLRAMIYSAPRSFGPVIVSSVTWLRRNAHGESFASLVQSRRLKNFKLRILESVKAPTILAERTNRNLGRNAFKPVPEKWTSLAYVEDLYGVKFKRHEDVSKEFLTSYKGDLSAEFREKRFIYFVTPTLRRTTQIPDLLRQSQALQIANLREQGVVFWIVVEAAKECSSRVRHVVEDSGLPFAHLQAWSKIRTKHKWIPQRNRAIEFILQQSEAEGVVYFGEDSNAFDSQLITELSSVKSIAFSPVGYGGKALYERCVVNKTLGVVDKFVSNHDQSRPFAIDLSGFAAATWVIREKAQKFSYRWKPAHLESEFIARVVKGVDGMQPMSGNCTTILAWEVQTSGFFEEVVELDDRLSFSLIKNLTG